MYKKYIITSAEVDRNFPKYLFLICISAIFIWYIFQMFFFALKIGPGISPDEIYHLEVSKLYSNILGFTVIDSPGSYAYGAVSRAPYLYHLIMGKLLLFNFFHVQPLIFLRFANILISCISLYLTFLLVKEFTKNQWIQLTVLIVQTNILMYVFISSMVSYDTLINLLSVLSFLFLFRFLKSYSRTYLLLLFITMVTGPLIKITYGPLVVIQLIILAFYFKILKSNKDEIFKRSISKMDIFLFLLFLILIFLNFKLYGSNIINYQQIIPSADKVFGHFIAYKYYPLYFQDYNFLTSADQRAAMSFHEFFPNYLFQTQETIFGIMGHLNLRREKPDLVIYVIVLFFCLISIVFTNKSIFRDSRQNILLFSSVAYLVIIFYVNYATYLQVKIFGLALQGRYNFPVLALIITYLAYNSLRRLKDNVKIAILLIMTPLLIYNCFFWFLSHHTPDWYIR